MGSYAFSLSRHFCALFSYLLYITQVAHTILLTLRFRGPYIPDVVPPNMSMPQKQYEAWLIIIELGCIAMTYVLAFARSYKVREERVTANSAIGIRPHVGHFPCLQSKAKFRLYHMYCEVLSSIYLHLEWLVHDTHEHE